jgi:undecaprenyl-diphosphatase
MESEVVSNQNSKTTTFIVYITAALAFSAAVILFQQQALDDRIVIFHNFIYKSEAYLSVFQFISAYGMGFISLIFAGVAFLSARSESWEKYRPLLLLIIFSFALGSIAGDLLKGVIGRERPSVALAGQIGNAVISDSFAFPSGHATKSLALVLPFVIVASGKEMKTWVLKILLLVSAILVAYSRIALQRHYLSDVLAALGVALVFVPIANWFVNRQYQKRGMDTEKLSRISGRLGIVFVFLAVALCMF